VPNNKAVFLDRDGVICPVRGAKFQDRPQPDKYLLDPDDFELLPGVADAMRALKREGYLVIVVTNQLAPYLGIATREQVDAVNRHMVTELAKRGATIDDVFCCCDLSHRRKPSPGMLVEAMVKWDIDPARSYVVGDSTWDLQAAEAVGLCPVLVTSPLSPLVAESLHRVAPRLLRGERPPVY